MHSSKRNPIYEICGHHREKTLKIVDFKLPITPLFGLCFGQFFFNLVIFSRDLWLVSSNSAQKVSKIAMNAFVLFFFIKNQQKEKKYLTLCPKILPLQVQERDLMPLVVKNQYIR
jgi:hypothetical protein